MDVESISVDGKYVQHRIYKIPADGNCLFSSLAYLVYGTETLVTQMRAAIVRHVSNNWTRLKPSTMTLSGTSYRTKSQYISEMSQSGSYGNTFDLMVAAEMFPYQFQVYAGGILIASFGEPTEGIKRIKFSGHFNSGHFDVLIPVEQENVFNTLSKPPSLSQPREDAEFIPGPSILVPIPTVQLSSDESVPEANTTEANSTRRRKRRKRFTDSIRRNQIRKSVSEHSKNNAEIHRAAVKKYSENNPEINRAAVKKYSENNPEIHRAAVKKYSENNPEINRAAVKKYSENNPEIHRAAVKKYSENNPEVNRSAVKKYSENNPEIHRSAVKKYSENNPEVNHIAVVKYNYNRSQIKAIPWTVKHLSGYNYDPQINYMNDKTIDIGSQVVCTWCRAKKWKEEGPGMCCSNGKVKLPALQRYPEPLHSLLTHQHTDSEHFLSALRKYNGCFQMTSFGAKEVKEGNFMPTFKVQGQVYHRIGSLLPAAHQQPSFLQIYFVGDDENEINIRCANFPRVKPALIGQLQKLLHDHNKYIKEFKTAIESIPKDQEEFQVVIHADKKPADAHKGRYNFPTTNEVAILIAGQAFESRDIVLHSRNHNLLRISETHRAYDSLQYPLMFCRGEDGYYINIPQCDPNTKASLKKTVSASQFYSYRIMERDMDDSYMLLFRNLFNQFLVDMYAKIETERLNWIRNNQKKLRSEDYVHLKDAMNRCDGQISEIGKMVVLPSTFTGGPRYMHERTQDAMTYVRHFGRPDLFITFTCNPKWRDITEQLKPGQNSNHRHDIVARVFHLKVKLIIKLLNKGSIFGSTRCHMYSVEWQKRGLPHVHILLWLEDKMKPHLIDKVISAEIPDPQRDPVLYDVIKSNMIHGPCGTLNRNSPCMVNGSCSKRYPRPLIKDTQTGDDGYPQYRRRSPDDGGFTVHIKEVELDNRWVVPYNPVLSRTFSAHINVEFCNSVKSIKYICKYVNKGSDQATFTLESELDEVTRYESGRYISSSEAAWRILSFPIHERFPPIMHLAVHLENGQRVYFTEETLKERVNNPSKTTLLAFFDLCKVDEFARTLLYSEVPSYYIWKNNTFCRRKQGKSVPGYKGVKKDQVLGRVYTIHPSNAECYYLRLLLHKIRGPKSFTAIKTVDGVIHPTFQSACRALGLLEDDAHWDHTLEEASISDSPHKIRELFAIMLVFCHVANPIALWDKHKESLAEDIKRRQSRESECVQQVMEVVYNSCLINLDNIVFSMSGHRLQHFGLPTPSRNEEGTASNREILRELNYDTAKLSETIVVNVPKLNEEQKNIYDEILRNIDSHYGQVFFLDAPGGTGKTFLINLLLATLRSEKKIAIAVASSGIAATLIDGGKTAHSAFKLPLNLNHSESALCNISKQSDLAQVLREAKLIVWDECTMSHKKGIEALDRTLQDIRSCSNLMGGITLLLAGDFRQTLPVVPRGTRADEVKACFKASFLWPKIKILSLKINMRVHLKGDAKAGEFSDLILQIGEGKILEENGKIIIPENLCTIVDNISALTDIIYPGIQDKDTKSSSWLRERAILTPTNDSAMTINHILLNKLPSDVYLYESIDSVVETEDTVHYPVEFLHTLNPPGLPPHMLYLKIGAPVMLLRNLNPPKLCNGTRLQVKTLHKNIIEATIFTGVGQGETVFIPRIPLIPSDYHFDFKRLQFPVKVCYAMTINKAQGQSLTMCGVDLRNDCFSHGQLYVACSRVSSPDCLVILQSDKKTTNVVYREVLDY